MDVPSLGAAPGLAAGGPGVGVGQGQGGHGIDHDGLQGG